MMRKRDFLLYSIFKEATSKAYIAQGWGCLLLMLRYAGR